MLKCLRIGRGDYSFKLLQASKLNIIHAAGHYGLTHVADYLLKERNPVIVIKVTESGMYQKGGGFGGGGGGKVCVPEVANGQFVSSHL